MEIANENGNTKVVVLWSLMYPIYPIKCYYAEVHFHVPNLKL